MQANLLELSKQGNTEAIAALMNRHLQAKGIFARVLLQDSRLKVMLDAIEAPDQQIVAPFVLKGISNLKIPSVQTIQVYGRKRGEKVPVWTQIFNQPPMPSLASETPLAEPEALTTKPFSMVSPQATEPVAFEDQTTQAAIAARLNQFVNDEAITIEVEQQGTLLKVIAETDKFLEGPAFAKGLYHELLGLRLERVETVDIYKKKRRGSHSFRIQSFTLTKEAASTASNLSATSTAQSTIAKPALQDQKPSQTGRSSQTSSLQHSATTPHQGVKKKENISGIRRKLTIGFTGVVAAFVVVRLVSRLAFAFSSPMGYFGHDHCDFFYLASLVCPRSINTAVAEK